jgi:hypothetical protein
VQAAASLREWAPPPICSRRLCSDPWPSCPRRSSRDSLPLTNCANHSHTVKLHPSSSAGSRSQWQDRAIGARIREPLIRLGSRLHARPASPWSSSLWCSRQLASTTVATVGPAHAQRAADRLAPAQLPVAFRDPRGRARSIPSAIEKPIGRDIVVGPARRYAPRVDPTRALSGIGRDPAAGSLVAPRCGAEHRR